MNSFIENVNYVAGLDNLYGSGIELYKNNLSLKSVQHDIELKFSYYNNDDKKIHSIVHSESGVLVGGIEDTLLSFKTLVGSSITGSEFTCTVSSGVQNFVINNIVMVNISIDSNNNTYKAYELEMKVITAGAATYDVFGEVKDSLKILPSLAMITASDVNAIANVYEIQEEVITVSENIVNIETVSDSIANVNTVGISISNVNIVGEDIANVNTVSTHISNVDTVSQSIANVNTVSSNIVDVGIASTNIASINTVSNAQNLVDIIRVADDLNSLDVNGIADITIVANDLVLGVDSNIITVSESIDNVNIVGNDIDNINIVVTDIVNIDIVSTNINDINITANDIVSINTVSSNIADVNTVSDGIINVNTVSGSIDNVNTVASNIVGLNSIVSNMPEILLADDNAAIATTKALESSDSAAASLQSSLDSAASAALFPNHIADTTNPHEVTKIQVGLEFAENTADIDKVVASAGKLTAAVNISLSGNASGSVSFDGSGDADIVVSIDNDGHTHAFGNITNKPTTLDGYGITDADTSAQVSAKIGTAVAALVDSSPATLDTLNELAAALGDDPNFATTISTAIGTKVTKNADITAGTATKVTYDAKGLVTSGTALSAGDIPILDAGKITTGTLPVVRGGTGTTISTGTGYVVLSTSPVLVTPTIGVATGTSFNSITGLSSTTPMMDGTSTSGTGVTVARADHVHPNDTTKVDANANITAGTYKSVTVDVKGLVTGGTNPTTIGGYGITDAYTKTEINSSLDLKVYKVAGKGLSTEDYTSIEKTKLDGIAASANNYSLPVATNTVLGGVKAGANVSIDVAGVISASASSGTPVGTIITVAKNTAPTEYLKANGALVSRTVYSALFAEIGTTFGIGNGSTTFALPDLRGEFIRGWDDGRGIDTSRAFGSNQNNATAKNGLSGTTDMAGNHSHTLPIRGSGSSGGGYVVAGGGYTANVNTNADGNHSHAVTISGDSETRPRNIALLYCIKY